MGTCASQSVKGASPADTGGSSNSGQAAAGAHAAESPAVVAAVVAQPVCDPPSDVHNAGKPSSKAVTPPQVVPATGTAGKPDADKSSAAVPLVNTVVPQDPNELPNLATNTLAAHVCVPDRGSNTYDNCEWSDAPSYVDGMVEAHRQGTNNRPLTCCSFRGGLCVDVGGRPWAGANVVDEFHMALTWIDALITVLWYRDAAWKVDHVGKGAAGAATAVPVSDVPPAPAVPVSGVPPAPATGAGSDETDSAQSSVDPPSGSVEAPPPAVATGAGGNAGAGSAAPPVPFDHSGFAADGPLGHVNFADPAQAAAVDWDAVDWDHPKLFEGHDADATRAPCGAQVASAWPWEESSMRLARVGPRALVMEDVHGSGRVVLPRVAVDIHDFAAVVHNAMMQLLDWSRRVTQYAEKRQQVVDSADGASDAGSEPTDVGSLRWNASEALGIILQQVPNPAQLQTKLQELVVAIQRSCDAVGIATPTLVVSPSDTAAAKPDHG